MAVEMDMHEPIRGLDLDPLDVSDLTADSDAAEEVTVSICATS